jgi:heme/copper-type cytochrome/quinol oxidase subunit 1
LSFTGVSLDVVLPCQAATRALSTTLDMASGDNVIVPLIANSLEFTLSSPPPIHQFQESPLIVETDHLTLYPGKEAEEVLKMQGHVVTDVIGKEKWLLNDPEKYEGLIPQNEEWTEFVDEKTGEWVYLDEYGNRVDKPSA